MAGRRLERALCAAALCLLALGTPATAQGARLHTGSTRYVRIVRLRDGQLTIALTARGRRQVRGLLAGRVLDATCTTLGRSVHGFTQSTESSSAESTLGRNGHASYHTLIDRQADFCDIGLARQTVDRQGVSTSSEPGPPLDSIALSQRGAAYLDEDRVTQRMFGVLDAASFLAGSGPVGSFPPAAKVLGLFRGQVVALPSPDASPSVGVVGFFSDQSEHAAVVALSALGHRLFIDSNAGVLSTDAQEHLFRVIGGHVATLPGP